MCDDDSSKTDVLLTVADGAGAGPKSRGATKLAELQPRQGTPVPCLGIFVVQGQGRGAIIFRLCPPLKTQLSEGSIGIQDRMKTSRCFDALRVDKPEALGEPLDGLAVLTLSKEPVRCVFPLGDAIAGRLHPYFWEQFGLFRRDCFLVETITH